MSALVLTDLEELKKTIANSEAVVVSFTAPAWCAPCQKLEPIFLEVTEAVEGVTFVIVDVDQAMDLARHFHVSGVPTLLFFRDYGVHTDVIHGRNYADLIDEIEASL